LSTQQAVLQAASALVDAFGRHDVVAYFAAFAEDASFLFHNHPVRLENRAAYQALWQSWEAEAGFRVLACQSSDQHVQWLGTLALFTHKVSTTVQLQGLAQQVQERESILFRQEADGRWLAVHEHLSPLPEGYA
jgi:ketosteroid isomerase-like protein